MTPPTNLSALEALYRNYDTEDLHDVLAEFTENYRHAVTAEQSMFYEVRMAVISGLLRERKVAK